MQYNATQKGVDILDYLVREHTCTRSTRHWPLTLFLNLIDVACVNAFVLWILKYPNWQQKKNNCRCLYLLSLGEEMVTPYVRRRADSGNMDRHMHSVMRAMDITCKQPVLTTNVKKGGGYSVEGALFVQQLKTEKQTGNVASTQNGCARTPVSRQFK